MTGSTPDGRPGRGSVDLAALPGRRGSAVARVRAAYARMAEVDRPEVWITVRPLEDALADAEHVDSQLRRGAELPLAGAILAVKDNIDVAGLPTTAGCPGYAYAPLASAPAVSRLVASGAVVMGKTNLDQFATGLVGTRSPYGAVRDARRPHLVSGGSSSGSAVAVALGIADLGLVTDTAGSGRVPAAFQGLVGIKPTRGLLPTAGVVPACRSVDCIAVFAGTVALAERAIGLMTEVHADDPTGRAWPADAPTGAPPVPRVAVPSSDQLVGLAPAWVAAFERAAETLAAAGAQLLPIDLEPFIAAGRLLYEGAFVAERYAAVGAYVDAHRESVDPTVGAIIAAARQIPAHRLVTEAERLDRLRQRAAAALGDADVLLVPTAPQHPSIEEVEADPVGVNSRLGTYTSFCNLLDMCGVAVPFGPDSFGVTVVGRAFADRVAADVARLLRPEPVPGRAVDRVGVPLAVVGAHLSGQPLNPQLTRRGARLLAAVATRPEYRLYALPTEPPKPGLVRVPEGGVAIEAEVWLLPPVGLAQILAELPAPMALGRVSLADGSTPLGFLCEPCAVSDATDISAYGGWRAYLRAAATEPPPGGAPAGRAAAV